jgi:membrane-associated phospholipid phosphatase
MPSFHTVIAIVLIYVHRPPARSFRIVATLSGVMLLSVPWAGNHYLSDMIVGAAIAAGSIALVRRMSNRNSAISISSGEAIV